jgi:hypothetical protein
MLLKQTLRSLSTVELKAWLDRSKDLDAETLAQFKKELARREKRHGKSR